MNDYKEEARRELARRELLARKNTQSSENRDITDSGRDLAYGSLKTIQDAIHNFPGYEASNRMMTAGGIKPKFDLENLKSPHPSTSGDILQMIGGFLVPGGVAQKEAQLVTKAISKIPKFTQKGAGKFYTKYENLAKEANPNIKIPSKVMKETEEFLKEGGFPTKNLFEHAKTGNYAPHLDIQKALGEFERAAKEVGQRAGARHLKNQHLLHHNESLNKQGLEHLSEALGKAQLEYSRHKKFKKYLKVGGSIVGIEEAIRRFLPR
jgi:hypothetical protein